MRKTARRKPTEREWVRPSDAARLLGVHRSTVLNRAARGEFRVMTVGGTTFVSRRDVEKAVKATQQVA